MKKDDFLRKIEKPWTMDGCVYSFLRRVTENYYVFEQVTPSGGLHYELVEPVRSGNGGRYPVSGYLTRSRGSAGAFSLSAREFRRRISGSAPCARRFSPFSRF